MNPSRSNYISENYWNGINKCILNSVYVGWIIIQVRLNVVDTMKLFQKIQDFYRILGVVPIDHNNGNHLNATNVLILCNLLSGFVTASAFWIIQAKSMKEYGDSFFASVTEFCAVIYLSTIIDKTTCLFELIENFEELVHRVVQKMNVSSCLFQWRA